MLRLSRYRWLAITMALACVAAARSGAADPSRQELMPTSAADRITAPASLAETAGDDSRAIGLQEAICDDCGGPAWIVRGGGVILTRSHPANRTLFNDVATGAPLLNARSFNFAWNSGPDIAVLRRLNPGDYLEVRFFDVASFHARQSLSTPGALYTNSLPPQVALSAADIGLGYASSLYSTEINFRRQIMPRVSWLAGFRAIQIRDSLDVNASLSAAGINSHLVVTGHNQLYGAQTGCDVNLLTDGGPFQLQGVFKAGVYGNAASESAADHAVMGNVPVSSAEFRDRGGQTAFVGEIGIVSVWQFTQRIWLRCGYQMLWVDGLALATNQIPVLNFTTSRGLNTAGNVYYHGALVGAEVRF